MLHTDNLSIGVFIDGGYYAKINEGLQKKSIAEGVNLKGLFSFIPEFIAEIWDWTGNIFILLKHIITEDVSGLRMRTAGISFFQRGSSRTC